MNIEIIQELGWNKPIENIEEKQILAKKIAEKVKDGQVIGFGSGSTSFLAVCEIAEKIKKENIQITAIPTSYEIEMLCSKLNIPTSTIMEKEIDWCFDGADEVDENNWAIKGRGAAMFKEKLNIVNSNENYILIDKTKKVKKIGEKHPIPVECFPISVNYVINQLKLMGAKETEIRKEKDDAIITDNGNVIVDVKFEDINEKLEKEIKSIVGVIETGLFIGYNFTIIEA